MLLQLSIHHLALINDMTIDFEPGMNVMTGETGAGKSIVVDAVNLVLGERADRDLITNGDIDLIINSPVGKDSVHDDSYLRKAAIKAKIPYMTTIAAAKASIKGILYVQKHGNGEVKSLQQIHSEISDK